MEGSTCSEHVIAVRYVTVEWPSFPNCIPDRSKLQTFFIVCSNFNNCYIIEGVPMKLKEPVAAPRSEGKRSPDPNPKRTENDVRLS